MNKIQIHTIFLIFLTNFLYSQNEYQKFHTVAFYNVENLFDTINDVNKNDEASPIMEIEKGRTEI